jgi:hypothetical protein
VATVAAAIAAPKTIDWANSLASGHRLDRMLLLGCELLKVHLGSYSKWSSHESDIVAGKTRSI